MAVPIKIYDNVQEFIDKAAASYGRMKAERFELDIFHDIQFIEITSPIEQMFYTAFIAISEYQGRILNPTPTELDESGNEKPGPGLHFMPQEQVGKFYVDFSVLDVPLFPWSPQFSPIAVELDGHDFHDRDKRQRSYEKARDRFLQQSGYKVLHFTGSDVVADPFKCAWEVLSMVGGDSMKEYDPEFPLGE